MNGLEALSYIRSNVGKPKTTGLSDSTIKRFLEADTQLRKCLEGAFITFKTHEKDYPEILKMTEEDAIELVQKDVLNFYPEDQKNPYLPLVALGPWIVTLYGAVLHDSGGYGMLGLGQNPQKVLNAMSQNYVMANVMTPSLSHYRVCKALHNEIGQKRKTKPYNKFIFMNSGSEAMSVALRIADVNTKIHAKNGQKRLCLNLTGSFHGRTERPAQISNSSLAKYQKALDSFHQKDFALSIPVNDSNAVVNAFVWAKQNNVFFEAITLEPVMGEGNPGMAITREFYDTCRKLSQENNCLLIIDSIQSGIRAQGYLSICDYPNFEDCMPPDMETYSKAINAAQYPLSILALNETTANKYVKGIYGNTMTANPRSLEVAYAVLASITPELRENIRERGIEFVTKLNQLAKKYPSIVTGVQGTGLLCSIDIHPSKPVCGYGKLEEILRLRGIGVIHGGQNALRFTPHFNISSAEIDLIIESLDLVLSENK